MKSFFQYFSIGCWLFFISCKYEVNTPVNIDPLLSSNLLAEEDIYEKIVVYQVMTRLFGNTNTTNQIHGTLAENGVGKMNDFTPVALNAIKDMGYTHIWYTGIIEHAVVGDYREYGIDFDDGDVIKGRAGSPYAIKDYYDVNPDLAVDVENRLNEFDALVQRTHEAGLKMIIDFVPNHVARSYKSDVKPEGVVDLGAEDNKDLGFDINNNFYYLPGQAFEVPEGYIPLGGRPFPGVDGQFQEDPAKISGNGSLAARPHINDWFETVKVNYGFDIFNNNHPHFDPIPKTWFQMRDILMYWAEKGVDGFRCDFIQFTPYEFWNWVIPQIKSFNPEIIFLGEIYVPEWYQDYIEKGKFDYMYDKVQLYDTVRHIMNGWSSTDRLPDIWKSLRGMNKNMLRFLENHDEQRIASRFFSGNARAAIPGMTVSATMYTGPVMVYFGQEDGEPALGESGFGGDDGRTTIFDYWGVTEHQKWMNNGLFDGGSLSEEQKSLRSFYRRLLNLCTASQALSIGDLLDLHPYNRHYQSRGYTDRVYAYIRFSEDEVLLVVVNFSTDQTIDCSIAIPKGALQMAGLDPEKTYQLTEVLDKPQEYELNDDSIDIVLEPLAARILKIDELK